MLSDSRSAALAWVSIAVATFVTTCTCAFAAQLPEVLTRIKPAVVAVGTYERTRNPQFQFRGTGFAVREGLLIATNAHVLPEALNADRLESLAVLTPTKDPTSMLTREASIVTVDREHDIALLRIGGEPLPALKLAESSAREGDALAFTGFPLASSLGYVAVTHRATLAAVVPIALPLSTTQHLDPHVVRQLKTGAFPVYQLDGTAYPGNSGSPLYDPETGTVVGIVNMVFVKSSREVELNQPTGISFAIPAQHLVQLLARFK